MAAELDLALGWRLKGEGRRSFARGSSEEVSHPRLGLQEEGRRNRARGRSRRLAQHRGVTQGHTLCQRHDHAGRPGMRSCSQEALALAAASWAACETDPCSREAWLRQGLQSAKSRRAPKCQGQNAYGCCRGYTQRFGGNIGSHNKWISVMAELIKKTDWPCCICC